MAIQLVSTDVVAIGHLTGNRKTIFLVSKYSKGHWLPPFRQPMGWLAFAYDACHFHIFFYASLVINLCTIEKNSTHLFSGKHNYCQRIFILKVLLFLFKLIHFHLNESIIIKALSQLCLGRLFHLNELTF